MYKLIFPAVFIIAFPILLFYSFTLLFSLSRPNYILPSPPQILGSSSHQYPDHSSLWPSISVSLGTNDARKFIIDQYLTRYNSPLLKYSDHIVKTSDLYGLDYRLLVAIAQQESNLCKHIPENSNNCWGFGIYGDKVTRFDTYPQAIETVAKSLRRDYLNRGLLTPEQIMAKYTPPSLKKGGAWAKGVNQFLYELE